MACVGRFLVATMRRLEKEIYLVQKTIIEEEDTEDLLVEIDALEKQVGRGETRAVFGFLY